MDDLNLRLMVLFPGVSFDSQPGDSVQLRNDGAGPFIAQWDESLGTQPTQQQLEAVTQQQIDVMLAGALRQRAIVAFLAANAIDKRAIVLALVDYLNVIGTKHNALLTWLGTQANLTQKAQLAGFALPDDIQPTQAKAAIEDKIAAGGED